VIIGSSARLRVAVCNDILPNRLCAGLSCADADYLLYWQDEDLAVADLSGPAAFGDGVNARLHERLIHGDLQLYLPQEAADLLMAAVDLGDTLLAAAA